MCTLTRQVLPVELTCCHWNVNANTSEILVITDRVVDPTTMKRSGARSVEQLFDYSPTAPEYLRESPGAIVVKMSELSVPFAYGVPSGQWDEALGIDRDLIRLGEILGNC